jgi:hypothetical protein
MMTAWQGYNIVIALKRSQTHSAVFTLEFIAGHSRQGIDAVRITPGLGLWD